MHLIRHMRRTSYESPAAPISNNSTDPVELNVFAAPNQKCRATLIQTEFFSCAQSNAYIMIIYKSSHKSLREIKIRFDTRCAV